MVSAEEHLIRHLVTRYWGRKRVKLLEESVIGKWWHDGEGSRVSSYDANWSNQKSPTPGNVSTTDRGERLLSLLSGKRKHHIKRWTKYRRIPRYSSFPCPTVWNWPTFLFVAFSFLCSFHRTSVLNFLTPTSQTGWGCYLDSSPWLFFFRCHSFIWLARNFLFADGENGPLGPQSNDLSDRP